MKSYIVDTFFGIFAIDESGDILEFIDFEDDHEKIIDFYNALDKQLDYKTSYNFKSVEIGEFRENLEAYLKKVGINKTREEILTHIEEIEDKLTKRKSH